MKVEVGVERESARLRGPQRADAQVDDVREGR
jgi:hypothetical protein